MVVDVRVQFGTEADSKRGALKLSYLTEHRLVTNWTDMEKSGTIPFTTNFAWHLSFASLSTFQQLCCNRLCSAFVGHTACVVVLPPLQGYGPSGRAAMTFDSCRPLRAGRPQCSGFRRRSMMVDARSLQASQTQTPRSRSR